MNHPASQADVLITAICAARGLFLAAYLLGIPACGLCVSLFLTLAQAPAWLLYAGVGVAVLLFSVALWVTRPR